MADFHRPWWSRTDVVAAMKRWAGEHDGRPPRYADWKAGNRPDPSWPSTKAVVKRFGSWSAAIRAAGYDPSGYARLPKPPELRELVFHLARTRDLTHREIGEMVGVSRSTVGIWLGKEFGYVMVDDD